MESLGLKHGRAYSGDASKTAHGMLISNNICYSNYYDGLDMQATYGTYDITYDNRNSIIGNTSWFNRATGLVINGKFNTIKDNTLRSNGTAGIEGNNLTYSTIISNFAMDNNIDNVLTGFHQIQIPNVGNIVEGNTVYNPNLNAGYNYYIDGDTVYGMNFQMGGQDSVYLGTNVIRRGINDYVYTPNGSTNGNITDCDTVQVTGFYQAFGSANLPDGNWYYLQVIGFGSGQPCVQIVYAFTGGTAYRRNYFDNAWTSWVAL
jgi:hypothetical protein